jgi:predicted ribosome quality control (RQC) complex YloA/Tae2 family protein
MRIRGPIKPRLTVHPLTGMPIVPIGFINGRAVWPICGGAPDDPDDDDKDKDDTDSGGGSDDGGDDADKSKDTSGDGDSKDADERIADLEKRMRAADQRASKAEKALKEREDAEKDELTRATDKAAELEKTVGERDATIRQLRLENSFLTANKHNWHDPDTALDLAERHGYLEDVVDEDGKVDKVRLGKALDRLAKEKAFLVKQDKKDDDPGGPSGEPAGGRSDNVKDEKTKQKQLKGRFPVLNR